MALSGPVLIGFAGALAAPETAWSLLDDGHAVVALARRGERCALRRSRAVRIVEITAPERDHATALRELLALAEALAPAAAMGLDDAAVWLLDAAARAGMRTPVAGPTGAAATLTLDKERQLAAAAAAGFAVPETHTIRSAAELAAIDRFPFVVKPADAIAVRDGRLARGTAIVCADGAERDRALAATRVRPGERLLAQPLLRGVGEGLFGLAGPDGLHALSAHRRIRMANPQGSGSSACVSIAVDPALAASARRMLADAGWRGLFMLEFLRDGDGVPWFMELNGRPWGSMALARVLGLEYPAWALRALGDPTFAPTPAPVREGQVCRHLGRELVHLAMVMRGPRSAALTAWPSRRHTLADVLAVHRGERWYNWRAGELGLFVQDTVATLLAHAGVA